MPQRSKDEFIQEASLSQQLADRQPDYQELAGADPKISRNIQRIKNAIRLGYITGEEKELAEEMLIFLDGDRKAAFATSEKVNEITKLGLQMPKKVAELDL